MRYFAWSAYGMRLYASIEKKNATTVIPTHHARATHIWFPTGCEFNRERTVFTIAVTGWFSANTRTTVGIFEVGTNAELMNGRKMSGYENALAPSTDFAFNPAITASHVSASVKSTSIPATSSHSTTLALERKPMMRAMRMMTTTEMALETSDVSTCAHKTDERDTGMEWNRENNPC